MSNSHGFLAYAKIVWEFGNRGERIMKKTFFKLLASLNKLLLPSYSKKRLDMTKASKLQLALIGWRYLVTKNAID